MMHLLKITSSCPEVLVKTFRLGGLPLLFAVISLLAHETHASAARLNRMQRRRLLHDAETLCYGYGTVCTKSKKPHNTEECDEDIKCKWHTCKLEACPRWPGCNPWRDETLAFNIICVRCSGTGSVKMSSWEDSETCPRCNGQRHGVLKGNGDAFTYPTIEFGDNNKTFTNFGTRFGVANTSIPVVRTRTAVATITVGEDYNGEQMEIGVREKSPGATKICWYDSSGLVEGARLGGWECSEAVDCKCVGIHEVDEGVHDPKLHAPDELQAGSKVTVVLVDEQIVFLHNGEQMGRAFPLPEHYSEIELFVGLSAAGVTLQKGEDQTQILQQVISTLPKRS